MNVKDTLLAALRRDPELFPKLTDSWRGKIDEEDGRLSTVVRAAASLEPILADAFRKRPGKLKALGLKSTRLLAGLATEDAKSGARLAQLARNGVVGIVFVDVVGFTTLTETRGDKVAIALLGRLERMVDKKARQAKGEVVKQLGDGFLLAFSSASQSVRFGIDLRDAMAEERGKDPTFDLMIRIAVHAGEPLVQGDDLLGHDVNLAARLLEHCKPDKILISEPAKELAERRLKRVVFGKRRMIKIRGLTGKVAAYPVIGIRESEPVAQEQA